MRGPQGYKVCVRVQKKNVHNFKDSTMVTLYGFYFTSVKLRGVCLRIFRSGIHTVHYCRGTKFAARKELGRRRFSRKQFRSILIVDVVFG